MFNFGGIIGSPASPLRPPPPSGCVQIGASLYRVLEKLESELNDTEHLETFREAHHFATTAPRAGAPITLGFARRTAGHAVAVAESNFDIGLAAAKWMAEGVSRASGNPAGHVSDGVDAAIERAQANAIDHFTNLDYAAVGSDIASRFRAVGPGARDAFRRAGSGIARRAVAQVEAIQAWNASVATDALRPDPHEPV